MKYISIDSVVDAYYGCKGRTQNKFWGLLAILKAIGTRIKPAVNYNFNASEVSNFLEDLFRLDDVGKQYSSSAKWSVMFSRYWIDYIPEQMFNGEPNIYDVATWYFRTTPLDDNCSSETLIQMFLDKLHITTEEAQSLFNFSKTKINFASTQYRNSDLLLKLQEEPFGYHTISFETQMFIKSHPGSLGQAPFIQTLYANQGIQKCLILTQFDFADYYLVTSHNKKELDSNDLVLQQIFYGAPGTGKSHLAKKQTIGKSVIRTTFHPDSDYSTFVGAYKPTTIDEEVANIIGREAVNVKNPDGSPRTEKKIIYEFVPQAFLQAYVNAWKLYAKGSGESPKEQFLIIEEINRGNCAQIFGDLFQLLDRGDDGYSDYFIKADKDLQKYLEKEFKNVEIHTPALCDKSAEEISRLIKEGEILLLPDNLYIWATMNTSDQSLFPIDSAFKRRWEWKYMPIANEGKGWTIEIGKNTYDWWEFLDKINTKIEDATYSEDKKLGYFFCKAKDGVIDAKTFVGKVLFYLWNDVFKDTDLADSLFADEDGKKSFDKFYIPMGQGETEVDTARVIAFMEKLTVKPLVEGENKVEEETDFVDENVIEGVDASSKGTKDTSVYSVNGIGSLRKKNVPHRVVSVYVEKNPDMTATEIVRAWNALGTMVTVVLSEDEYNRKKEKTSDSIFETRYNEIRLNNGEKIYVFNQFNPERINDFVSKVNAQSWGIRIEKVEE